MNSEKLLLKNFNLIRRGELIKNCDVMLENGRISSVNGYAASAPDKLIDGEGRLYLSSGFIDLHVHGGGGFDFMDADPTEYAAIARHHAIHGTTALYPTTLSASHEELLKSVEAFETAKSSVGGARMLGMHLEGPYLSKSQKGAMDEKYIRVPQKSEYEELCSVSGDIRRITAAPELEGSIELGKYLTSRGILPSCGHTDAIAADVIRAYEDGGYRLMTHLYSAMSMTRRIGINRYAGAVEAAYMLDGMYVEIIADGIHLPAELLKLIYKLKGSGRIALITDAMRGSGMPEGETAVLGSRKNGQTVLIEDGVAKLCDRTAFAGSIATSDRLVRNMVRLAGVSLPEAVRMATETPAEIMRIDGDFGSAEKGKAADIIAFDDDINVKLTIVGGNVIHNVMNG